jgi:CDGSH-type Zn-finger protein
LTLAHCFQIEREAGGSAMADAKAADTKPMLTNLEPGTYWWCACGHSERQPYCDGSHRGTGFTPLRFEITDPQRGAMCMCKRTHNAPFCDGNHSKL